MRNTTSQGADRRHGVQAIARAAAILRALENAPGGCGISEIATATGLPKSTAHRIVAALADEDMVVQEGGRVRLGGAIDRLAAAGREALVDRLRPVLLDLRRQLDETVDLAVLDGAAVRFVDQVAAPRRLRATSAIGELFPLHCTANGKALLATMTDTEIEGLLPARLERYTPNTIVSRARLLEELDAVRRGGVAFDREEHTAGISAVGAALSEGGRTLAAISVPVPTQRFSGRERELAAAVGTAADAGLDLFDRE